MATSYQAHTDQYKELEQRIAPQRGERVFRIIVELVKELDRNHSGSTN
jgi:hypothetical protein